MARVGAAYAHHFNRRYERVGHLFQGRYKSRLIEDDSDLLGVLAYVNGNPVKHGVTSIAELPSFAWCSYGALIGRRPAYAFEDVNAVWTLLGEDRRAARVSLAERVAESSSEPEPDAMKLSVSALAEEVMRRFDLTEGSLFSKRRQAMEARATLIDEAKRRLGLSGRQIARALRISEASITRASKSRNRNSGV